MMFTVGDEALKYCKEVLSSTDPAKSTLRIYESKGCCFSYYGLDIPECGAKGDVLVEADGLKIFIEPTVLAGFSEATLDYVDGLLAISGQGRPVCSAPLISTRDGTK